jgi:hypothetical protein
MTNDQIERRAYARQRLVKIAQWLHGPADQFGECDECHNATVALWEDIDADGAGDGASWCYCRECWGSRAASLRERLNGHDEFELVNDPPRRKSAQFDSQDNTRQRTLLDGMDCLPGQLDLF